MRNFLFFLLISGSFFSFAQKDTADDAEIQRLLSIGSRPPVVGMEYTLGAANTDVDLSLLLSFATQPFLKDVTKENILSDISGQLRFGYWQNFNFFYRQPRYYALDEAYHPGYRFRITNSYYTSGRAPREAAALALFGNKRFAGETIDLGPSTYESWWYTSLAYQYQSLHDSIPYALEFAIIAAHSHQSYSIDRGMIYTQPDGEYIDADLDYELIETIDPEQGIPFNGLGFATGFETQFPLNRHYRLDLQVEDLGVIFFNSSRISRVDSNFRFRGGSFENIFEINDSLFKAEEERLKGNFYSTKSKRYTAFMPFKVRARVNRELKGRRFKNAYVFTEYRHLSGFLPRVGLGTDLEFGRIHKLNTEAAFGGFNTLTLGVVYSVTVFDSYQLRIGTQNLIGLALPFAATGSSVYGAFIYTL